MMACASALFAEDKGEAGQPAYSPLEHKLVESTVANEAMVLYRAANALDRYLSEDFFAQPGVLDLHHAVLRTRAALEAHTKGAKDSGIDTQTRKQHAAQIDDAKKAAKAAEEAFAPMQARIDGLTKARSEALTTLAGTPLPPGAKEMPLLMAADETAILAAFTGDEDGPVRRVRARLGGLKALFDELGVAQRLPDESARARAKTAKVFVLGDASTSDVSDAVARAITAAIKEFDATWRPLRFLHAKQEDALAPFVFPGHPGELLGAMPPYTPVKDANRPALMKFLEQFARRYPDGRIAAEWRAEQAKRDGVKDAKGSALIHTLGTDDKGLVERALAIHIVNDLAAALGDFGPAKSFRKDVVKQYSDKTDMTFPDPIALFIAIFGSAVLFGGLALSIWRAARSGKNIAPGPTT